MGNIAANILPAMHLYKSINQEGKAEFDTLLLCKRQNRAKIDRKEK